MELPNIDYGVLKFPICAWQMLALQGLMTHEEANKRMIVWLDNGGMDQFIENETNT